MNADIKKMIVEIRRAITTCRERSEAVVLDALLEEAESWQMRRDELPPSSEE